MLQTYLNHQQPVNARDSQSIPIKSNSYTVGMASHNEDPGWCGAYLSETAI